MDVSALHRPARALEAKREKKLSVKKKRRRCNPCYNLIRKYAYDDIFTIVGRRGKQNHRKMARLESKYLLAQ